MASMVKVGDQSGSNQKPRFSIANVFSHLPFLHKHNPETPQLLAQQRQQLERAAQAPRELDAPAMMRILQGYEQRPVVERSEVEGRFSTLMNFLDRLGEMEKDKTAASVSYFQDLKSTVHDAIAHQIRHTGFDVVSDILGRLPRHQLVAIQKIVSEMPKGSYKPTHNEFAPPVDQLATITLLIKSLLQSMETIELGRFGGWSDQGQAAASPEEAKASPTVAKASSMAATGFRNAAGAELTIEQIVNHLATLEKMDNRAHITAALEKLFRDYPMETILEVRDIVAARSENAENGNKWVYLPIHNSIKVHLAEMSRASGNGKSNGADTGHAATGNGHVEATGSMQASG